MAPPSRFDQLALPTRGNARRLTAPRLRFYTFVIPIIRLVERPHPSKETAMSNHRAREANSNCTCPDFCRCQQILAQTGAGVNTATCDELTQNLKEERTPVGTLIEDVV